MRNKVHTPRPKRRNDDILSLTEVVQTTIMILALIAIVYLMYGGKIL